MIFVRAVWTVPGHRAIALPVLNENFAIQRRRRRAFLIEGEGINNWESGHEHRHAQLIADLSRQQDLDSEVP